MERICFVSTMRAAIGLKSVCKDDTQVSGTYVAETDYKLLLFLGILNAC